MFKKSQLRMWCTVLIMVFAVMMPTLVLGDGTGNPDPPMVDPPQTESPDGGSSEMSDLELLAMIVYYTII